MKKSYEVEIRYHKFNTYAEKIRSRYIGLGELNITSILVIQLSFINQTS